MYEVIRALEQVGVLSCVNRIKRVWWEYVPRPVRQPGATRLRGGGSPAAFPFAWTLARFAAKRRVRPRLDQTARTAATLNPMQRRCADRPASPSDPLRQFRYHPLGASWASPNRRSS